MSNGKKSLFNVKLIILRAADVGHRRAFGTIDLYVTYDANVRLVHDSHCCKTKVRFLQALHVVLYVTTYNVRPASQTCVCLTLDSNYFNTILNATGETTSKARSTHTIIKHVVTEA